MSQQEFLVQTYGLALWLIARGLQPIGAQRVGLSLVFVFPAAAAVHFESFQAARKQLAALQHEAEQHLSTRFTLPTGGAQ